VSLSEGKSLIANTCNAINAVDDSSSTAATVTNFVDQALRIRSDSTSHCLSAS
jgi:hypothetical protein